MLQQHRGCRFGYCLITKGLVPKVGDCSASGGQPCCVCLFVPGTEPGASQGQGRAAPCVTPPASRGPLQRCIPVSTSERLTFARRDALQREPRTRDTWARSLRHPAEGTRVPVSSCVLRYRSPRARAPTVSRQLPQVSPENHRSGDATVFIKCLRGRETRMGAIPRVLSG